jgi:hypothetical protein
MSSNLLFKFGFALLATASIAAASSAFGQSMLDHLVVNAPSAPVTVHITQDGAAKLGETIESVNHPVILNSTGTGALSLTVEQVVSSGSQASLIQAYTTGSDATTISVTQKAAGDAAVNDVWAKILLGTQDVPAAKQNVTLLQTGDKAQATIESVGDNLSAYIVQQGSSSGVSSLNIASNGANNTYGTAGSPITLGALSTLAISNTGASNTYAVSLAASSSASITNIGSANTYNIETQLSGDSLSLAVNGSGNAFTFDFSTIGTNQYKAVAWGSVETPASVTSGNFVAQCGGSTCWVTDTSSNGYTAANLTAAANASVTPR